MHKIFHCLLTFLVFGSPVSAQATRQQPNVLLIITDDQGYGDFGFTGNPHVQTPVLDQLAAESVHFTHFFVSPVCAPTRSSLMTGRYSLRTGITDTYNGGAIMASGEVTIAELLKQAGYVTGAFGKWHLGDNYPSRPGDQGFDESLIHLSGGMGQVGDVTTWFRGDSSYFDPVLWHNGRPEQYQGYCSDIFAGQASAFIKQHQDRPFFCYLAFNAPHTPLQVPDAYYEKYKNVEPSAGFSSDLKMSEKDKEDARKVYAMVHNIDDNLGRIFQQLKDLKIDRQTLVIFLTDNGPQQRRYVGGMRGLKGNVYSGGVRVPLLIRYPDGFPGRRSIAVNAAHIDLAPTIADICKANLPADRTIDGRSLVPLLQGQSVAWSDRPLFFHWTRRLPERYQNMALLQGSHKLVGNADFDASPDAFELFDLDQDPGEQVNLSTAQPAIATALKRRLDSIYLDLIQSPNLLTPPGIIIGDPAENPVLLNRNDASGERGIWAQEEVYGYWKAAIKEGCYNISFRFIKPLEAGGRLVLQTGTLVHQSENRQPGVETLEMKNVCLPELQGDVVPFYAVGNRQIFPFWVRFEKKY